MSRNTSGPSFFIQRYAREAGFFFWIFLAVGVASHLVSNGVIQYLEPRKASVGELMTSPDVPNESPKNTHLPQKKELHSLTCPSPQASFEDMDFNTWVDTYHLCLAEESSAAALTRIQLAVLISAHNSTILGTKLYQQKIDQDLQRLSFIAQKKKRNALYDFGALSAYRLGRIELSKRFLKNSQSASSAAFEPNRAYLQLLTQSVPVFQRQVATTQLL